MWCPSHELCLYGSVVFWVWLGQLTLCGRCRIRGWCDALWYFQGSPQIPGSTWLLTGPWWFWGLMDCLPFLVPWASSTATQGSWSPCSTRYWQWWCLARWSHSIVLCHTWKGVAYGTFLQRRGVVLRLLPRCWFWCGVRDAASRVSETFCDLNKIQELLNDMGS